MTDIRPVHRAIGKGDLDRTGAVTLEQRRRLQSLEAHAVGEFEDPLVAEVCHHDRDLILRLIRLAEEQTISWRASVGEARAAGAADEARVAAHELRAWARTVRDLRAALRHVVTFGGSPEG